MKSIIIIHLLAHLYEISSSKTQVYTIPGKNFTLNHSNQLEFLLYPRWSTSEEESRWMSSDAPVSEDAAAISQFIADHPTIQPLPDNVMQRNHVQSGKKIMKTEAQFHCKDYMNRMQHTSSSVLVEVLNSTFTKRTNESETNASCPCLEDIDFLGNITQKNITALEHEWPCEVRIFWFKIHWFATLVRFLFQYGLIIIVVIGLLFNALSFCVLSTTPMNTCSVSVYLRALAVADTVVLIHIFSLLLRSHFYWINEIYLNKPWLCTLAITLNSMAVYYSTWLVAALTLERLIMVVFPFSAHNWGNTRTATWVVLILAGFNLGIAALRAQVQGLEKKNIFEFKECGSKSEYWSGYFYVFISFGSWIPTILIIFCNIYLMIQIRLSATRRTNLRASRSKDDTKTCTMTRMLLLVSATYLFTALPMAIAVGIELYWKAGLGVHPDEEDRMAYINWKKKLLLLEWIRSLFDFFFIMNFGCNFFLYCISGQKFRNAVKDFLCWRIPSLCIKKMSKTNHGLSSSNNNHKILGSTSSTGNLSLVTNKRLSNASTTSEFVYHNDAFTNTEKEMS